VKDKKVHLALLKPTHSRRNTFLDHEYVKEVPVAQEGSEKAPEPAWRALSRQAAATNRQMAAKTKLRVLHSRVPGPINPAPCDTCKTSVCCSAFVIQITPEEYESGLYGDSAVALTSKDAANVQGKLSRFMTLGFPHMSQVTDRVYFLEGTIGVPCPLLGDDNRCSIYEDRPIVCRTYSCMDDPRITQEHRDGVLPASSVVLGEAKDD